MAQGSPVVISKAPEVSRLEVKDDYDELTAKEKFYAHYSARAVWSGAPIIMDQTSPESISIFHFVIEIYNNCSGNWNDLATRSGVTAEDMRSFLSYAAVFLHNIGNYFGDGDQKFVPDIPLDVIRQLSRCSDAAVSLFERFSSPIVATLPLALGFPSDVAHSSYYPGNLRMSEEEISSISERLGKLKIEPENTRIHKLIVDDKSIYEVLQSSIEESTSFEFIFEDAACQIRILRGSHKSELSRVCKYLEQAKEHAANPIQRSYISKYQTSFTTGDMKVYRASQREWVKDIKPAIDVFYGFIEPYRDPFGIRAEFEGLCGIVHEQETKTLTKFAERSSDFIRRLPWANYHKVNDGKGPFEKELFEIQDFTSVHTLAYCSSIIFPGKNLPNYNDIRQDNGFKNIMVTNGMTSENSSSEALSSCLDPSDVAQFLKHREYAFFSWVVFHELLGHGTSKLLVENPAVSDLLDLGIGIIEGISDCLGRRKASPIELIIYSRIQQAGTFNFDIKHPPTNPLTGKPIESWYKDDQTWTGVFGSLATTVDECRAECVGAYLLSDMELLEMFGYTDSTEVTGRDLEYNMYMQLGVAGLRALENYNLEDRKWGQAHSRAHFAMFKVLLASGDDFLKITHDKVFDKLTVKIDRRKILTHGNPAIGALMLKLHIWRCTANVKACREYYEELTEPDGEFLEWRRIQLSKQTAKQIFVQPNTFIADGEVVLKEYDATVEGMIQSWVERVAMIEADFKE